ncbi:MAG: hypothetical protein OHK93_004998 [Ramalina farinacea]|uniref:DUF7730 domain-containing protein n=1 Tax=Ramalina farinacea TaxID=258253 RepID=A0AA43QV98_9LECA|nr:hypothetical protein [Ramalina farinacea]
MNEYVSSSSSRNAQSSSLLRLPPEIQRQIYQMVLGGRHLRMLFRPFEQHLPGPIRKHFKSSKDNPGGLYCLVERINGPLKLDGGLKMDDLLRRSPMLPPQPSRSSHHLAVPMTCRYLYQMTALMIYSHNVFSFDTTGVMKRWVWSLKPVQREAVRFLVPCERGSPPKAIRPVLRNLNRVIVQAPERREWYRRWVKDQDKIVRRITINDCFD